MNFLSMVHRVSLHLLLCIKLVPGLLWETFGDVEPLPHVQVRNGDHFFARILFTLHWSVDLETDWVPLEETLCMFPFSVLASRSSTSVVSRSRSGLSPQTTPGERREESPMCLRQGHDGGDGCMQ